jgi:hypothetical protein
LVPADGVPFPRLVFPVLSVVRSSCFLRLEKDLFGRTVDAFFNIFEISSDENVLALFLIARLLRSEAITGQPDRIATFTDALENEVNSHISEILRKMVLTFEPITTRLLNSNCMDFDIDDFIATFQEIYATVQRCMDFPASFQDYLRGRFVRMLDARLIAKVLANPARLKLSHFVAWNFFTTAIQELELELPAFTALVNTLVLVPRIDSVPIPRDVNSRELIYILKNWQLDELYDSTPEWEELARRLKISIPEGPPSPREVVSEPFDIDSAGWVLANWNDVEINPDVANEFRVFRDNLKT